MICTHRGWGPWSCICSWEVLHVCAGMWQPIATDRKPLVKIFGNATLESIKNPRLFFTRGCTMPYEYTSKHIPGTKYAAPDACSRRGKLPASTILCTCIPTEDEVDSSFSDNACMMADAHTTIPALLATGPEASTVTIDLAHDAGLSDNEYNDLLQAIREGFPNDASLLAPHLRPHWKVREDLSCLNGLATESSPPPTSQGSPGMLTFHPPRHCRHEG